MPTHARPCDITALPPLLAVKKSIVPRCEMIAAMLLLAASAGAARAQTASLHPLTPEQAINLRHPSDPEFSPDGSRIAFVVREAPGDSTTLSHIWIVSVAGGQPRQLTWSDHSESSPRWSPDGRTLAFIGQKGGQRQIYALPMNGGERRPITKGHLSVRAFAWSPDGKRIAFLAPDSQPTAERKRERERDDARVVDKDDRHARLRVLTVATEETRALTPPTTEISTLEWLGDGHLVVRGTDTPASDLWTDRLYVVDASDGGMRTIVDPHGPLGGMKVSPDGHSLAYVGARTSGPTPHDLYLLPLSADGAAAGAAHNLTAPLDRDVGDFVWTADGHLLASVREGFHHALYSMDSQGHTQRIQNASPNPASLAVASNGTTAFVGQTATTPPELYVAAHDSTARRLTDLNASWKNIALVAPQSVHYKSFDGLDIDAELLRPKNAGSGPLPMIVLVHGGPAGAWSDAIEGWGQLLVAKGFAVFYPNIRGSVGYGQRFIAMDKADWGGADFKDVMAGVDAMVQRGVADPNKLGIGGWSYGGYMSEWAITQTNRFKAAVSGAGMVDLIAEFSTERGPAYDRWYFGLPYENSKEFLESSPFMYMKNAHTPTLILQGLDDTTDPPGQSEGLYRALKFYGVPAELVEYPREEHGLRERHHLVDRLTRVVDWFTKYVR
ncbi:MAG TPA: S9 family peptidase [Gemmatimonadaceae bacterium]|nr:S9 family peptidase [Gemmatimonadaceae bacterium]